MTTRNPHVGAAYAHCPNCGAAIHQPTPQFNALDLNHKLPAGDARSGPWQHPGSSMTATCPRCGQRGTFTSGTGQKGFSQ